MDPMYGQEPTRVHSVRLADADVAMLDDLVAAAPPRQSWMDPKVTRSSVIRAAIADRHAALKAPGGSARRKRTKG
jgi:hypothetical protein